MMRGIWVLLMVACAANAAGEPGYRFRFVGPAIGNRVASIAGIPGDSSTYYAGAASGGIFKSSDGGNRWVPIFDGQPAAAIGALAVAPSEPATVWAGTGEAWAIRDSDMMGNGIYQSTDAGKTWQHMGLDETGRIGRIVDDLNRASDMANRLEWMRKQLEDVRKMLAGDGGRKGLLDAAGQIDRKMRAVEYRLISEPESLSDDKYFVAADKVYLNLIWLNAEVGTGGGDVAGGADGKPTDTSVAVLREIEKDLDAAAADYRMLMERDVPAFNRSLSAAGVTPVR